MASVTYQIKGKYDNKAVKSAQSDLTAIGKSIKGLGIAAWGKVATEVIKGVSTVVNGSVDAFTSQNNAAAKLNATIKNSGKDFSKLAEVQSQLSKNNFFDGDTLNNAQSMAINMGLTQDKVVDVMNAAEDLAATGIMPLDQAVKALSQSYSGNVSQIGRMIPEIKNLTATQLKNGEAVKVIAEKYQGMADAMTNTFSGRDQQWKNNFSDLQASVGGIIESFKYLGQGALMKPLNDLTSWLVDNRNSIINFFLHLPDVAKTAFSGIKSMLQNTFENLPEWFSSIGQYFVQIMKDGFQTIFEVAKEAFKGMGTLLDFAIGNPFRKSKDFINTLLNNLIEGINSLPQHLPNWVKNFLGIDENTEMIKFRFNTSASDDNKTWNETASQIVKNMENATKSFKDGATKFKADWMNILDGAKTFYGDDIETMKAQFEAILGQDLPADLQMAFEAASINFGGITGNGTGTGNGSGSGASDSTTNWGSLLDGLSFDWVQSIFDFVSGIENVTALLNPFQTVMQSMYDILTPVVNSILSPLVGALRVIGQTLGYVLQPLLEVLSPIIEKIGDVFVWLYNKIIVPVANNFIGLFTMFKNAVISIINGILTLINKLPGVNVALLEKASASAYQLSTISYDSLVSAGTASSSSSSGSSSSASYTAARDVYVTINFDHSFVNGDATEIAIVLKNEIAHAEALGY